MVSSKQSADDSDKITDETDGGCSNSQINSDSPMCNEEVPETETVDNSQAYPDTEQMTLIYRFRHDQEGPLMWLREMLSSIAIVIIIGLILFGLSGVWPPMVAIESGSMEPNMEIGDLVFVTEPDRFAPNTPDNEVSIITYREGDEANYRNFGSYGDVVVFMPPDRRGPPIIHRAMFYVNEGEDWHNRANSDYIQADNCEELQNCPATNDGYITKGDNNIKYDQASGQAEPVKKKWITGVARFRIPYLGYIRLLVTGQAVAIYPLFSTTPNDSRFGNKDNSSKYRYLKPV